MQTKTYLAILLAWLCLYYAQPLAIVEARPLENDGNRSPTLFSRDGPVLVLSGGEPHEGVLIKRRRTERLRMM